MALILFYTMLPAFTASLAGAIVFNSMVMSLGTLFACLWIVAPLTSRIIIKDTGDVQIVMTFCQIRGKVHYLQAHVNF